MKWRTLLVLLILYAVLLPFVPWGTAMASNITNAEFYGIITISNNGTAATDVITTANISTDSMIDASYLASDISDAAVRNTSGDDVPFMPVYGSDYWMLYVPSIAENTYLSNLLYCRNVTGGELVYYPDDTGMETDDAASLEMAANFTVSQTGYIITSGNASAPLAWKQDAFVIHGPSSGNVTASILGADTQTDPTGFSDPDANWTNEGDAYNNNLANGGDLTGAAAGDSWCSNLTLTHLGVTAYAVRVYAEYDAAIWNVIDIDIQIGGDWADVYQGTYPDLAWQTYVFPDGQATVTAARFRFYNDDPGAQTEADLLREVDFLSYNPSLSVSAAVSEGEHNIVAYSDSVDMKLYVDGTEEDTAALGGATVPDTANDWYSCMFGSIMYLFGQNITVGGNSRQQIDYDYDSTFTDQSGNGNDATPIFLDESTDADVIGYLSLFAPMSEAQAPPYSLSEAPDFITTAPSLTGNFSTTVNATFPGAALITAVATAGDMPVQLPMHMIFGFGILMMSLVLSWAMRRFGSGSLIVKGMWIACIMGFAVGIQVYDLWMMLIFVIIAVALAMASRQQGWT